MKRSDDDQNTEDYYYYIQVSYSELGFNEIILSCNPDNGVICKVCFKDSDRRDIPSCYVESEDYILKVMSFYNLITEFVKERFPVIVSYSEIQNNDGVAGQSVAYLYDNTDCTIDIAFEISNYSDDYNSLTFTNPEYL